MLPCFEKCFSKHGNDLYNGIIIRVYYGKKSSISQFRLGSPYSCLHECVISISWNPFFESNEAFRNYTKERDLLLVLPIVFELLLLS